MAERSPDSKLQKHVSRAFGNVMAEGGKRCALTSVSLRIPEKVIEFLQAEPLLCLDEGGLNRSATFHRCVDYPTVPEHVYYEGYFHGLETAADVESLHPRRGSQFPKPAAPPRLRAFIVALREVNEGWAETLAAKVEKMSGSGEWLAKRIREGRLGGDLAVQVHYGEAIDGKNIGWHTDAPNSLIHWGLSLRGRRSLHTMAAEKEQGEAKDSAKVQEVGAAYLSSPATVRHGVEYFSCDWKDRVIAIQCRMLLTSEELYKFYAMPGSFELCNAIAEALAKAECVMPSLEQVQKVHERIPKSKPSWCAVM